MAGVYSDSDYDSPLDGRSRRLKNILGKQKSAAAAARQPLKENFSNFSPDVDDVPDMPPTSVQKKPIGAGKGSKVKVLQLHTPAEAEKHARFEDSPLDHHDRFHDYEEHEAGGLELSTHFADDEDLRIDTQDHIKKLVDRSRSVVEDQKAQIKRTQDALEGSIRELESVKEQEMHMLATRVAGLEADLDGAIAQVQKEYEAKLQQLAVEHAHTLESLRARCKAKIADSRAQCEATIQYKADKLLANVDHLVKAKGSARAALPAPHAAPAFTKHPKHALRPHHSRPALQPAEEELPRRHERKPAFEVPASPPKAEADESGSEDEDPSLPSFYPCSPSPAKAAPAARARAAPEPAFAKPKPLRAKSKLGPGSPVAAAVGQPGVASRLGRDPNLAHLRRGMGIQGTPSSMASTPGGAQDLPSSPEGPDPAEASGEDRSPSPPVVRPAPAASAKKSAAKNGKKPKGKQGLFVLDLFSSDEEDN